MPTNNSASTTDRDSIPLRDKPMVLVPYVAAEVMSLPEAAKRAGVGKETMRRHVSSNNLGRRVAGQWAVSRPALAMWLNGDRATLRAYLRGDRADNATVSAYFSRENIDVPQRFA